jgi:phosphoadenosine phosphosulfate reductase
MLSERPAEVILEAVDRFGADRLALAASWQKETAVLVDLVRRHAPEARIFTLDTGALFEETYATWRKVEERYGITVEAYTGEWVPGMWATDPDRCCFLRKVEPLERALADSDCWISGVRRDQSPDRAGTEELDWDERNGPLEGEPARGRGRSATSGLHLRARPPVQPVCHDQGYSSIGCTHCTLPGAGREGRWAGLAKSECGCTCPSPADPRR